MLGDLNRGRLVPVRLPMAGHWGQCYFLLRAAIIAPSPALCQIQDRRLLSISGLTRAMYLFM